LALREVDVAVEGAWKVEVRKSKRTNTVRLHQLFVRSKNGDPLLAKILRVPRGGGAVALKTYLVICLRATAKPYGVTISAARVAELLGIISPSDSEVESGTRRANALKRVNRAINRLGGGDYSLLRREGGKGVSSKLFLLLPGSREEWREPPSPYVSIPIQFFERGYVFSLSGRAIALYIILRELIEGRKGENAGQAWVSGDRKREYGLSDDTWTRATQELEEMGLLESWYVPNQDNLGELRRRKVYRLLTPWSK